MFITVPLCVFPISRLSPRLTVWFPTVVIMPPLFAGFPPCFRPPLTLFVATSVDEQFVLSVGDWILGDTVTLVGNIDPCERSRHKVEAGWARGRDRRRNRCRFRRSHLWQLGCRGLDSRGNSSLGAAAEPFRIEKVF